MAYNIRLRNDTRQNWLEQNPTLAQGEVAIEFQDDDNRVKIKVGNGNQSYQDLPYFNSPISYTDISNKPQLNGIEINGNKSLIDYGIQPSGSYLTTDDAIKQLQLKADKADTYSKDEVDSLFESLEKLPEIGTNRDMFLKIDTNGQLYWSPLSDNIYTKTEVDEALANKVSTRDGYSLISDAEKERLASVFNYDDTEVKEDIEELWTDVHKKAYLDDLDNYVSQETLTTTLEDYALLSDVASKANASDLYNHINNQNNPHNITKEQLDLGNVDNTSDLDKPISNATQEALDNKQDSMEIGFGLALEEGVLKNTNPNVNADWNATEGDSYIVNKPQLSKVAISNDYNDLDNKPYIPTDYYLPIASEEELGGIKIGKDFTITKDGVLQANYSDDLYDYMQMTNKPSLIVLDENNVEREYQFIPGMTKEDLDIAGHDETQSALNLKADKIDTYTKTEVDDLIDNVSLGAISWGKIQGSINSQSDLKYALDAKANELDLSRVAFSNNYNDLDNKPTIPTKVSELTNDSGYLTTIPSEYITEKELNGKGYLTVIPSEYITETELNGKGYQTTTNLSQALDDSTSKYPSNKAVNDAIKAHASSSSLGSFGFTSATTVPEGCAWCNGEEYTQAQFPDFYQKLADNKFLKTDYTTYNNSITKYGSCGYFALDTANKKFKVPTLKDVYIKAGLSPLMFGQESLPNITGTIGTETDQYGINCNGAFYSDSSDRGAHDGQRGKPLIKFDASRSSSVYKNDAKVNTDHVVYKFYVVLYSGSTDVSMAQTAEFIEGLNNKANIDLSNVSTSTIQKFVSINLPDYSKGVDVPMPTSSAKFTAPSNGLLIMTVAGSSILKIDDRNTPFRCIDNVNGDPYMCFNVPLSAGNIVYWSADVLYNSGMFYPFKTN